ncbi:MAG: DALR anticodon-binding domain-containing protein [Bacteroidales bacterium]|nr:DALR anticodon-binding domain-containing protein [Bacteroidales bacterium]MDD3011761.1 DALR anticodon-binding domain-containing protein [Bacteroidales bacterium]MDD3961785.1 DALR anticodon-binding domain-containing protein [Bacteroidales bacterium]MDY0286868.1 DALR anticodon-binding domain-containing protein [Bacteroidales bacterium]
MNFRVTHCQSQEEDENKAAIRLSLVLMTGRVIQRAMALLGIAVPERM